MQPRWRERFRAAAIAVVIGLGFVALEIGAAHLKRLFGARGRDSLGTMFLGFGIVYLVFILLTPLVVLFARRFPVEPGSRWRLALHVVAALVFSTAHIALVCAIHLARGSLGGPYLQQVGYLLGFYLVPEVTFYASIAAIAMVVRAQRAVREREVAAADLGARLAEARLAALRGQLQPHFLFNAMNSVGMLIREERPQDALTVLAELAALLRTLLREGTAHEVPLDAELEFSRRYLALEQVRFGDRLRVELEVGDGLAGALVPHLVLQPLVENAVHHGVSRKAGPARVRVRAFRDGAHLALEVWNDGPAPGAGGGGTGLATARGRLASLYGDDHVLQLEAAEGGALARVRVPFHTLEVSAA